MAGRERVRRFGLLWLAAGAAAVSALAWGAFRLARPGPGAPGGNVALSLGATLGGADTAGYARAVAPRHLEFPVDHGAHPDFRSEWWYVTGNAEAPDGRRFGYQLTLFRSALAPPGPAGGGSRATAFGASGSLLGGASPVSPWRTRQAWMGHFALTDVRGGTHHAFDRFSRGAMGLAGAGTAPVRVWVEDWALEGADGLFPLRVVASQEGVAVDLRLSPVKGIVLQGEDGLSRKGPEEGNASYYYSFPRLATEGEVRVDGERVAVAGLSWLDREWSTSALPERVVGWDWFALQLDGGRDLMVYRLRRADGSPDPLSEGVLVEVDGLARRLAVLDVDLDVRSSWRSPATGVVYPSGWRIRVPGEGLDLDVRPVLSDQEMDLAFRYWEGAVDVEGRSGALSVRGWGYVELTGYGESPGGVRGTEGG